MTDPSFPLPLPEKVFSWLCLFTHLVYQKLIRRSSKFSLRGKKNSNINPNTPIEEVEKPSSKHASPLLSPSKLAASIKHTFQRRSVNSVETDNSAEKKRKALWPPNPHLISSNKENLAPTTPPSKKTKVIQIALLQFNSFRMMQTKKKKNLNQKKERKE